MFATSPNAKTILFPVEATQLMGTLGGIGELRQGSAGQAKAARRRATADHGPPGVPEVPGSGLMFDDLEPGWIWAIGGVLLLIAEIIAPGFFLVFVGAAAIATGLFTLLFDLGIAPQLVLFAVYSALAVMIGKRWYGEPDTIDEQSAAQRSEPAAGRQDRDGGRAGRRPWRPGARRRRRMECARRPCGAGERVEGDRRRGQLPDVEPSCEPCPRVIEWSRCSERSELLAPPGAWRAFRPALPPSPCRGCARDARAARPRAGERSRRHGAARLDRRESARPVARKRDQPRHRHRRARRRFARSSPTAARPARTASPRRSAPTSPAPKRSTPPPSPTSTRTSVEVVRIGLSHRARRLRPALWRRRGRRLAQHALCRDPECRRLSRRAALPRHRPSGRRMPPTPKPISPASTAIRPSSTASSAALKAAARAGPDRPRLPDRQGDQAR